MEIEEDCDRDRDVADATSGVFKRLSEEVGGDLTVPEGAAGEAGGEKVLGDDDDDDVDTDDGDDENVLDDDGDDVDTDDGDDENVLDDDEDDVDTDYVDDDDDDDDEGNDDEGDDNDDDEGELTEFQVEYEGGGKIKNS